MTREALDAILGNPEFNECIKEAVPHRVKIVQDIMPQMKEVQDAFLQNMVDADWNSVSEILARLKKDKKDETAKDDYARWKKKTMGIFKATLKVVHPNEGQVPGIGVLYSAGSMLKYIEREDLITGNENYDCSNPLNFRRLEDFNQAFDNDDMRAKMKQVFLDADEIQGDLCAANDAIKKEWFQKLPATIRYDKDTNKKGLKESNFAALVRNKAMGFLKDKDKYTKYINAQVENSHNNIDREEVVLGKTREM